MKIKIEFGRRGRHSQEGRYEALEAALDAVSQRLVAECRAHDETKQKLSDALWQAGATTVEMPLPQLSQGLRVVYGGPVRFPLANLNGRIVA